MVKCKLSGHITRPCDVSGAGGIRKLWAISATYITAYTKSQCLVTAITTQTSPTTELFWEIQLADRTSSSIQDPTTDADGGAFYRQVQLTARIAKTASNRCILSKLVGDSLVFVAELNDGSFSILGLTGRGRLAQGLRFVQSPEGTFSGGGFDTLKSDLLIFKQEDDIPNGILEFQRPIPNYDGTAVYAIGDVVYDNVNDCYFQSLTAGPATALPACDNSNVAWQSLTEKEAKRYVNEVYLEPLINP
jgi:hypothetical protein